MVAMAELGSIGAQMITHATEMAIYQNIWRGDGPDDSPVSYVVNFFIGNDRSAELFEDQERIADIMAIVGAMAGPYGQHRGELDSAGVTGTVGALSPEHFADNARVLLVALIDGNYATHYLLARQDAGGLWVMNPDGGTDTQEPDLFTWANGQAGGAARIGNVDYIFSGIFVRVT